MAAALGTSLGAALTPPVGWYYFLGCCVLLLTFYLYSKVNSIGTRFWGEMIAVWEPYIVRSSKQVIVLGYPLYPVAAL